MKDSNQLKFRRDKSTNEGDETVAEDQELTYEEKARQFKVRCVKPNDGDEKASSSEFMLKAVEGLKEKGFNPEWFTAKQCLNITVKEKNCVYLFEEFQGKCYDHLLGIGCRILGPMCILESLVYNLEIQRRAHPVYNLAMKDTLVCFTNMEKSFRDSLQNKIQLMGGKVSKDFTEHITHLVAGEVGSKKYQVAGELNKMIMTPDWVQKVWQKSQKNHILCTDAVFLNYKCPLFKGLVVTVSGLDPKEKEEVKKFVTAEGGKYTGEMKVNECTHLIINKPKGAKYEYAKKWKIYVVKLEWFYDSIQKGYCQDEAKYKVENSAATKKSEIKTSTPEKNGAPVRTSCIADISCISNISMMSHINETAATNQTTRVSLADETDHVLNSLDLTNCPSDIFLDGCKIYLSGFRGTTLEKLRKIINAGGGTRLNQLNENVTHVVIGEQIDKDINVLKSASFRPSIVNMQWLAECYRVGQLVTEDTYKCLDLPPVDAAASPSFKGKKRQSESGKNDQSKKEAEVKPPVIQDQHEDMEEIMSQYLLQADPGATDETVVQGNQASQKDEMTQDTAAEAALAEAARLAGDVTEEKNDETVDDQEDGFKKIFKGKTFMFFGFDEEPTGELSGYVLERGGKVVSGASRLVPDYAVVPIDGFQVDRTVGEVTTNAWLQMCMEQEELLTDNNPLYFPLDIRLDKLPLQGCVLSVSGFSGVERDCLMQIGDLIGARCQEYFVRKANKGLERSTHLIVKEASGSKYEAAKKWGVPAVSERWLIASARSGTRESEERYHIDRAHLDVTEKSVNISSRDTEIKETDNKNDESGDTTREDEDLCDKEAVANENRASKEQESVSNDNNVSKKRESVANDNQVSKDQNSVAMDNQELETNKSALQRNNVKNDCDMSMDCDRTISPGRKENKGSEDRKSEEVSERRLSSEDNQKTLQDSQKENLRNDNLKSSEVQSKPVNNRIKALQGTDSQSTPKNSPLSRIPSDMRTPSPGRFLDPSKDFHPVFDLTAGMNALDTPASQRNRRGSKRKASLPLEDLYSKRIDDAVMISESSTMCRPDKKMALTDDRPLSGLSIVISKKLSAQHAELNNIITSLGGEYVWPYNSSCTHFVFQGKTNDLTKEFRTAKDQGKIIVSPYWVYMCKEQNARVDESLFPHSYNPNLSLSVVTGKSTPTRSTRRSSARASVNKNKDADSDTDVTNEPTRKSMSKPSVTDDETHEPENKTETKDPEPAGGSVELREVLSKQLENIKAVSKVKKNPRRKSKRLNSSGQLSASGEVSSGGQNSSHQANRQNRWSLHDEEATSERRSSRSSNQKKDNYSGPEASQSVQITWDDPTGRLEEEKLAHKLERAYSPTQDAVMHDYMDGDFSDIEDEDQPVPNLPSYENKEENKVPTPEHPTLAFPGPKTSSKAEIPQQIDLHDADTSKDDDDEPTTPPIFILSGIPQEEKDYYGALVEQLGGKMCDGQQYDPSCTHLVIGVPSRNEKFLASVASGKWVLHKSYFEACRKEGKFVQEDFYEWGGDGTSSLASSKNSQVAKLAAAAHYWRLKITEMKKENSSCPGAFEGWKVLLLGDQNKESNFRRLLIAGKAAVLGNKPPFSKNIAATHAFVELNKCKVPQEDLECLLSNSVKCLRPDFIAAHLIDRPSPDPAQFCPPEIDALRVSLSGGNSGKRKSSLSSSRSKRSKR